MKTRAYPLLALLLLAGGLLSACGAAGGTPGGEVDVEGTWSTTLSATESSCPQIPVGTTVTGNVVFEVRGTNVTATSDTGAVSTGTIAGTTVTLTRVDVTPWNESYNVNASFELEEDADSFSGQTVYALESGCVVTWAFSGSRVD